MRHPKDLIENSIVKEIRRYTFRSEMQGSLPEPVLDIIYQQKWLQILMPAYCGGGEYTLPAAVRLFEALAWADANVGWCVNLGAGANMFAGYFDAQTAKAIFRNGKTWCAGSGACTGTAIRTGKGYLLSGRWKYASGANHATHFTANAFILDENSNEIIENGHKVFRSFIVPAEHVTNYNNWEAIGLKATSSNDFEVKEVFVPQYHTFSLLQPSEFASSPLYRFPFRQLAIVNMSSMIMGMAIHFIDLYLELAQTKKPLHSDLLLKDNSIALSISDNTIESFYKARFDLYQQLDTVWQAYADNLQVHDKILMDLDKLAHIVATASRKVFYGLYPLFGMSIVHPQSPANKVWRDAATASQHYLLSPLNSETG